MHCSLPADPWLTPCIRYTYPGAWINTFVTGGLIYLQLSKSEKWSSPWHTYLPVSIIYLVLNLFLVITPFVSPNEDWNADGYPYYAFPLVGTGVLFLGAVYWLVWTKAWPEPTEYTVLEGRVAEEDGGGTTVDDKILASELGQEGVYEPLLRTTRRNEGYSYDSISSSG